jgi:hypothetical protein
MLEEYPRRTFVCVCASQAWSGGNVRCGVPAWRGSPCVQPHPTTVEAHKCKRGLEHIKAHIDSRQAICLSCMRHFDAEYEDFEAEQGFFVRCGRCKH